MYYHRNYQKGSAQAVADDSSGTFIVVVNSVLMADQRNRVGHCQSNWEWQKQGGTATIRRRGLRLWSC